MGRPVCTISYHLTAISASTLHRKKSEKGEREFRLRYQGYLQSRAAKLRRHVWVRAGVHKSAEARINTLRRSLPV